MEFENGDHLAVRMISRNPHLVYIDDSEDSEDEVFVDKHIKITPRKTCEKYSVSLQFTFLHTYIELGSCRCYFLTTYSC